eukprot:305357_1
MAQLATLLTIVEQATHSSDLLNIASLLPLETFQSFISDYISTAPDDAIHHIYHKAAPLDEILPCDVMQSILSFYPSDHSNCVSKEFNKLTKLNTVCHLKTRKAIIQDPQFKFDLNFKNGSNWIVDFNFNLERAIKQSNDGDTLLLCDGEHMVHIESLFGVQKQLSLIGVGDEVVILLIDNDPDSLGFHMKQTKLYFKEVQLELREHETYVMLPLDIFIDDSHLWMEECVISSPIILHCNSIRTSMRFKTCYFDGDNRELEMMSVRCVCQLEIIGCKFSRCGQILENDKQEKACIELFDLDTDEGKTAGMIKIIGNIFKNNKGRSVVYNDRDEPGSKERQHNHTALIQSKIVRLYGNIFQKKNGALKQQTVRDPNEILLGIQEY